MYVTCVLAVVAVFVCDMALGGPVSDDSLEELSFAELKGMVVEMRSRFDLLQIEMESLKSKSTEEKQINTSADDVEGTASSNLRRSKRDTNCANGNGSRPSIAPWRLPTCKEGKAGRDGRDGRDGQPGPVGAAGRDGLTPEQLTQVLEKILAAKNEEPTVAPPISRQNDSGAVYTRWGRTVCPTHSELIYEGFVAGSHYTHGGGGVNKLCLPSTPQWEQTKSGYQSGGHIYGAEFEVNGFNPFSSENTRGHSLHDSNAVCAVCFARSRPSHVMIPANKECPRDWTKEYNGYLMSSHYTQVKSSYDCVDMAPEVNDSGVGDQNGALFYIVESTCGNSLPCPPYVAGAELTCVVCTR